MEINIIKRKIAAGKRVPLQSVYIAFVHENKAYIQSTIKTPENMGVGVLKVQIFKCIFT
jgi:hypothetical protein